MTPLRSLPGAISASFFARSAFWREQSRKTPMSYVSSARRRAAAISWLHPAHVHYPRAGLAVDVALPVISQVQAPSRFSSMMSITGAFKRTDLHRVDIFGEIGEGLFLIDSLASLIVSSGQEKDRPMPVGFERKLTDRNRVLYVCQQFSDNESGVRLWRCYFDG